MSKRLETPTKKLHTLKKSRHIYMLFEVQDKAGTSN